MIADEELENVHRNVEYIFKRHRKIRVKLRILVVRSFHFLPIPSMKFLGKKVGYETHL